jgi:hypothetical protein
MSKLCSSRTIFNANKPVKIKTNTPYTVDYNEMSSITNIKNIRKYLYCINTFQYSMYYWNIVKTQFPGFQECVHSFSIGELTETYGQVNFKDYCWNLVPYMYKLKKK